MVSKVLEKLINNGINGHLEKCAFFYPQYGFGSSRSKADPLIVVSDKIARCFNRSGTTRAVTLDTYKAFDGVWYAGLLHKPKSYGISGQTFLVLFLLFSVIDGFGWFWMGNLHKKIQLMLEFLKGSFLVIHFPLLYIEDLPDDVICSLC